MKSYLKYLIIMFICSIIYILIFSIHLARFQYVPLFLFFFIINCIYLIKNKENINKKFLVYLIIILFISIIAIFVQKDLINNLSQEYADELMNSYWCDCEIKPSIDLLMSLKYFLHKPIIFIYLVILYTIPQAIIMFFLSFLLYKLLEITKQKKVAVK